MTDLIKRLKDQKEFNDLNDLIESDLEMLNQGFKFEIGELDWYLDEPRISTANRRRLLAFKRIGKV
jgi:hypothetical protein